MDQWLKNLEKDVAACSKKSKKMVTFTCLWMHGHMIVNTIMTTSILGDSPQPRKLRAVVQ